MRLERDDYNDSEETVLILIELQEGLPYLTSSKNDKLTL
jgi:hypothetical protein